MRTTDKNTSGLPKKPYIDYEQEAKLCKDILSELNNSKRKKICAPAELQDLIY